MGGWVEGGREEEKGRREGGRTVWWGGLEGRGARQQKEKKEKEKEWRVRKLYSQSEEEETNTAGLKQQLTAADQLREIQP